MALDWERLLDTYANRVHFQEEDVDYLKMLIRTAVAAEREACAELVEDMGKSVKGGYNNASHEIAEAIRARKEK